MNKFLVIGLVAFIYCSTAKAAENEKHLFILSGQSNMTSLNLDDSFIPLVEEIFGKKSVLVVKDAENGQSIKRWYKKHPMDWKFVLNVIKGKTSKTRGDLYYRLMQKVEAKIQGKKLKSITFIWMQGERDAFSKAGNKYKESWEGLLNNLKIDLGRSDINFIIGRLSDFDMNNEEYPHWTMLRDIQVSIANESPVGAWVDTDNFNGINDSLHYTYDGYILLGKAFAKKSIELIRKPQSLMILDYDKN